MLLLNYQAKMMENSSENSSRQKVDPMEDPRDYLYKLNEDVRLQLDNILESSRSSIDKELKENIISLLKEENLNYESLSRLHQYIQRADLDYNEFFYQFVSRCQSIAPAPRANKELERRLKYLKKVDSQRNYNKMTSMFNNNNNNYNETSTVTSSKEDKASHMSEIKQLRATTIAVINSFLVFLCTFIFCYKAVEYSMHIPHIPTQVLSGIAGSTIVAIAELYFLFRIV